MQVYFCLSAYIKKIKYEILSSNTSYCIIATQIRNLLLQLIVNEKLYKLFEKKKSLPDLAFATKIRQEAKKISFIIAFKFKKHKYFSVILITPQSQTQAIQKYERRVSKVNSLVEVVSLY